MRLRRRPVLLDLCAGAGAAAVGYCRGGFEVIGVDITPQPRFPFQFIQADIRDITPEDVAELGAAAIHASPPCQRFSRLASYQRDTIAERYDDLIDTARTLLEATGLPYVIENVPGAPLRDPVELCGCMFPGVNVYRRRLIETNWPLPQLAHAAHGEVCARNGYLPAPGQRMTVTGGKHSRAWQRAACAAMGTPWLTVPDGADAERARLGIREVCEAVPPAYFEWVGGRLAAQLAGAVAA